MKFKAIVFDMDGTIIDTESIWHSATKKLIENRGTTYSHDLHNSLHGKIHGLAMDKVCGLLKDTFGWQESIAELIQEKSEIAMSLYGQGIKFIPGFTSFHTEISAKKIKTGIATNADDKTLKIAKSTLQLENYFGSHIYNISFVNNQCKPNPAIYLYAMERLNVNPKECIAIEDSANGIEAAQKAGMFCIGINTSKNYEAVKKADLIIEDYENIILEGLI